MLVFTSTGTVYSTTNRLFSLSITKSCCYPVDPAWLGSRWGTHVLGEKFVMREVALPMKQPLLKDSHFMLRLDGEFPAAAAMVAQERELLPTCSHQNSYQLHPV